jgi:hypothetical protein
MKQVTDLKKNGVYCHAFIQYVPTLPHALPPPFVATDKSTWLYNPEDLHQHGYHIVKIYKNNLIQNL